MCGVWDGVLGVDGGHFCGLGGVGFGDVVVRGSCATRFECLMVLTRLEFEARLACDENR